MCSRSLGWHNNSRWKDEPFAWLLGGNTRTNPATQFIGTSDNQPLAFRTNSVERMASPQQRQCRHWNHDARYEYRDSPAVVLWRTRTRRFHRCQPLCLSEWRGRASTSDRRLKSDIQPLGNLLEKALQLKPVSYYFKSQDKAHDPNRHLGFIAQDVEALFPSLVAGNDTKTLNYTGLSVVAIGALQEMHKEMRRDKKRLNALEAALMQKRD